jgi:RimJ/RimL family protein N-acetyltransferase
VDAIETGRLRLVPLRVAHADEMASVLADPGLHTYIGGVPSDAATLRARYQRWVDGSPDAAVTWCNWVIALCAEDCLVGTVQVTITVAEAEIAWVVGTRWQGRGFATEAARGVVDWLGGRGVPTVLAHIHPGNAASAAVARSLGMRATDEWQDGEIRWRLNSTDPDST